MAYNIHQLPNGIRVVHTPAAGRVCYCGLIVNTGSRDESEQEQGLAHFIEHVVFKGTERRKAFHILNRLNEVGGELNAYTTKEETTVHASFLERDFERAADVIADMVFHSTFPARELEKEKVVIADEISSYKDTPSDMIFDEFEEQIFTSNALGHNTLGSFESLQRFTSDDVRRFMREHYHTDQMVFSVWGNLPWTKVVRVAEKYFGCVPESRRPLDSRSAGEYRQSRRVRKTDTHQCHVVMGATAPDSFDDRRLPMFMLNNYLGGPCMNSRLSIFLREKNGIAYNIEATYTPFVDTGVFTIYFGTDVNNLDRSMRIINRELEALCTKNLTAVQLNRIKRQFVGQLIVNSDDGENQMLSIGRSVLLYNAVEDLDVTLKRIEAITPDDIRIVANEVVRPDRLSHLVYQ